MKKKPSKSEWNQILNMLQSPDEEVIRLGANLLYGYNISHHYVRDAHKLINAPQGLRKLILLKFKNYESVLI